MDFDIDNEPLRFGKYNGQTPEEIAEHDPGYIVWLYDTVKPRACSKALALSCEQDDRDDDGNEDQRCPDINYRGGFW